MLRVAALFCATVLFGATSVASDNADAKALLLAADKLVSGGRSNYQDAIAKYTQALQLDPKNARGLYSRAELWSMMKKRDECLADLSALLAIDPLHRQGLQLRVKLSAQVGDLLSAAEDQVKVVQHFKDKGNTKKAEEALVMLDRLRKNGQEWQAVQTQLQSKEVTSDVHRRKQINEQCVRVLQHIISDFAKDSVDLRLRRAECALACRDRIASSDELKFVVKREPQNLRAASLSAAAFRFLGATDQAKGELKRCLSLDPEYPACARLHKILRQHQKLVQNVEESVREKRWEQVLTGVDEVFALEDGDAPNSDQLWRWRCEAYAGMRNVEKGLEVCETLLQLENGDQNPQMYDIYLTKADLYIINEDLAAADVAVRKAAELQQNNDRVREYQQKIERLKKAADRKDYYKILGVAKNANSNEVRRAYRKLSKQYHPDQLRSKELTKEQRDKYDVLYRDINEAKEVLMDEEKRRRFDNGEDVTKPPEQQGGFHHGSPFHFNFGGGGGFPGGGGQQFHFNFG